MSKFSGLRDAKKGREELQQLVTQHTSTPATQNTDSPEPKKLGRPRSKRSDPAYVQVSGYIPKNVYLGVKFKLLKEGNREFSALLKELLTAYAGEFIE